MSKTIDLQVEKSRELIKGYRQHIAELQSKGVTAQQLDKMEADLARLEVAGEECDRLRAQLGEKVHAMNEILQKVKEDFQEQKKLVKTNYEQPYWLKFGIQDRR